MPLRPFSVVLVLTVWQAAWARHAEPSTAASQSESGESASADPGPGFTSIGSVTELRRAMASGNQRIRMTPGVYRVTDAAPDNQTVFLVTGSDNHFDLRGVTLQVETEVLANLRGPVHSLATYRVLGSRITFEGGRFENTGDHPPFQSLSDFAVAGDDVTFRNCRFIIRGSAPYGYGDLYGKGGGAAVRLQKHSAIGITGDRTLIEDCDFRIHAFGHGIHVHGAQDTVIRNVTVEGDLRRTCELYDEVEGLAARFDHKILYPPWSKGQPIPRNRMLSLTEDGIRAYVYGNDRDGNSRRTGHITVDNCVVKRMRGGITLGMAARGTITGCTVLDSGGYAYSVPSDGVVRNCRGNAAYSPLLVIPYKQTRRADIELELIGSAHELGDHPLARITGDAGHRIRIEYTAEQAPEVPRPIVVGSVGDRYTEENTDPKELIRHHIARRVQLENRTPHPVRLTEYAFECTVISEGPVEDGGEDNRVEQIVLIDPPEQEFFSKRLDYEGIPIKAHRDVSDEALYAARQRLEMMLGSLPSVRKRLRAAGAELHIIGRNQVTSDLPDYRHMRGKPFAGKQTVDERTRGFGGRRASCGEENLLTLPEDRYRGRDICVHEFAHTIFDYGTTPAVRRGFEEQYRQSLDRGLWAGAYAATNPGEFFAELSMWYFGTHGDMRMKGPPPGKGPEGLKAYDPEAFDLFDRFYSGQVE